MVARERRCKDHTHSLALSLSLMYKHTHTYMFAPHWLGVCVTALLADPVSCRRQEPAELGDDLDDEGGGPHWDMGRPPDLEEVHDDGCWPVRVTLTWHDLHGGILKQQTDKWPSRRITQMKTQLREGVCAATPTQLAVWNIDDALRARKRKR